MLLVGTFKDLGDAALGLILNQSNNFDYLGRSLYELIKNWRKKKCFMIFFFNPSSKWINILNVAFPCIVHKELLAILSALGDSKMNVLLQKAYSCVQRISMRLRAWNFWRWYAFDKPKLRCNITLLYSYNSSFIHFKLRLDQVSRQCQVLNVLFVSVLTGGPVPAPRVFPFKRF